MLLYFLFSLSKFNNIILTKQHILIKIQPIQYFDDLIKLYKKLIFKIFNKKYTYIL